jgi:outer membrane cobalamin receptor
MRIIRVRGGPFDGSITTHRAKYEWYYSREQKCCESFGADFEGDFSELYGKFLLNVDLQYENSSSEATLVFDLSNDTQFKIRFYNRHNGYYTHTLNVYKNDKIIYNVSL